MKKTTGEPTPWSDLDEAGSGLTVNNFVTTRLSALINTLRRELTTPYATQFDLSVTEWRLLSLIAHAKSLPFSELVVQSTSDKSLVSRTVRLLEERKLVDVKPEGGTAGKRLTCSITPAGRALHAKIIPIARRRQAEALRVLSPGERDALFSAICKLQRIYDR